MDFSYKFQIGAVWCSPWKLLLKITFLVRKNGSSWGQGFEPHTFQVSFDPLMLLNLPITYRAIYTHLKLYSGCKKSQKNIFGLRAIQPLCSALQWGSLSPSSKFNAFQGQGLRYWNISRIFNVNSLRENLWGIWLHCLAYFLFPCLPNVLLAVCT